MLILCLVVVGARELSRPRRRSLSGRRPADGDHPHARCPAPRRRRSRCRSRSALEEAVNTVEGIDELRSVSGAGHRRSSSSRSTSSATSTPPRRTCATASPRSLRDLPRDVDPPIIAKSGQRLVAGPDDRAVGRPLAARADRDRRQDRQGAARALARASAKSQIVGGLERAINIWVDADRLAAYQLPITAVRDALARQNADVPGGNVTDRRAASRRCARWAASPTPREFNDLVIATRQRRADPRPRHRLRRGRHQGAALARAAERRADRDARRSAASPAPTPSR